jgi:predicted lipoprotein with Yx(FWY)xxD motif
MSRTRFPMIAVVVVVAALVAVLVATSGASTKKSPQNAAADSAISLKQTSLGQTLVDANGRTLYLFVADKPNVSTLSAAGQAVWPPFTAHAKPRALGGAAAGQITLIPHAGGPAQVSYNGHPLYYYVADHNPGQTLGQGLNQFGALWYVLSGNGSAITSAPSSPAPASNNGVGTYYGY